MFLVSNSNNIGLIFFCSILVYFLWKDLREVYHYNKIFDFVFLFLICGFLIDRFIGILLNGMESFLFEGNTIFTKVGFLVSLMNFDGPVVFSLILFLFGGLVGLFIYDWVNSSNKLSFYVLDKIFLIFLYSLLPLIVLSLLGNLLNPTNSFLVTLLLLIRLITIVVLVIIYESRSRFWVDKSGIFASITIIFLPLSEIFIGYLEPTFQPHILGLFSVNQIFAIVSIIIGINVLLVVISNIQDGSIERRNKNINLFYTKGSSRITNPLNVRLKNLRKQAEVDKKDIII